MKKCVIVIPIYKSSPSSAELASFVQCYRILYKYDIVVFTHKDVDLTIYQDSIKSNFCCKYFPKDYFSSILGYNTLLKEYEFYKNFKEYDYMLIYQLDAWVFKDVLTYWCEQGYDYVGAPWFEQFGYHEHGKKLWKVGNGGFSLRKVCKFMQITNPHRHYKSLSEVFKSELTTWWRFPICILRCLGYRNTVAFFRNYYKGMNEDEYFCVELERFEKMRLNVPTPEKAAYFSIERSPEYLYNFLNCEVPFGCHAWERYDKTFWSEQIARSNRHLSNIC